ncbi:MAG: asparaginase, partial [Planktomarina sp.]|nr:asparaginase [Planktomarina sp.]|tara:strand:+ start:193 stop:1170 length:978 start_codon:yes stop_codon:yes gene_type:complete
MLSSVPLVEVWRGEFLESQHRGHAVMCGSAGEILQTWGDPAQVILPRSSCKILQALPLITSGAADAFGLNTRHLALACASHQGAQIHSDLVQAWVRGLGKTDDDFRCGPQWPRDISASNMMVKTDQTPCRYHNNCSGKHSGFLTLGKHLNAGPDYQLIEHPVQQAVFGAFEEMTDETSSGYGIDGCSAPNWGTSIAGLARAMARSAGNGADRLGQAAGRLRDAMIEHPELVAGETRACTELMRAAPGVALKTGAEAVFTAIIPSKKIGIAVKIEDGAFRASEAVITALLIQLGVLDAEHPSTLKRLGPIYNWDGLETGRITVTLD